MAYLITIPIKSTTRPAMQPPLLSTVGPPTPRPQVWWMGPSGMPAAPEVSRLPPPGSQATEPEGGSGAERRGAGQARHARTHTRQKLGRKELVEIWRNVGRVGEAEGYRMHEQTGGRTRRQQHSGQCGFTHNMFVLTACSWLSTSPDSCSIFHKAECPLGNISKAMVEMAEI